MSMIKKIWLCGAVLGIVVVIELLWFGALLQFHQQAVQIAVNGSAYTNNMTSLRPALESSPFYLSFLPILVGVVGIIIILRQSEK